MPLLEYLWKKLLLYLSPKKEQSANEEHREYSKKKRRKPFHGTEEQETDKGSAPQETKQEQKKQIRNQLPSTDEPESKLEKKIKKWFTAAEEGDRPLIIEEKLGTHHQILVVTYYRAILFEAGCLGRLKDTSDKVWRQFVSVHLTEDIFSSSLTLRFFPYNDSTPYYNPSGEKKSLERWYLSRLNKEEARRVYSFLKDKELFWQEERRKEQVALRKPFGKPPGGGGAPPQKKG
ncbi:MAG: hypothetical protein D3910_03165 [Candidatus Electrothrix sp. ATG2]|nr:hypothetical protein [Candidatus Electrothrix sp. ATG2]